MRELPILMSGAMVRAVLEGRKTVTRRKVDRVTGLGPVTGFGSSTTPGYDWHCRDIAMRWHDLKDADVRRRCPFGQVGDRLYVRETWALHDQGFDMAEESTFPIYQADTERPEPTRWRPSIHMPKEFARIWLEVTAVRVERLQDINRGGAMDEGCPFPNMASGADPRQWFADLWESINGAGSWAANPWVWAVEFKRVEVPRG